HGGVPIADEIWLSIIKMNYDEVIFKEFIDLYFIDKYREFFKKTDFGYSLSAPVSNTFDREYSKYDIYVSDGKITRCSIIYEEDELREVSITNFGTTEIEIPKDIMEALESYVPEE
ncbi:MAG: hypothetical protein K2M75_07220, partial [Clostridia bacterium]|nr:hypothetical protein [Clostridia bacterium]